MPITKDATESADIKLRQLLRASMTVLRMFKSGHHPTESQLSRLENTIMAFEAMKMCGHKLIDECDCLQMHEAEVERTSEKEKK